MLRYSFATHSLNDDYDLRMIQELFRHWNAKTTMISRHTIDRGGKGVYSPIDRLWAWLATSRC
jgi:site-specific recombinase XerD